MSNSWLKFFDRIVLAGLILAILLGGVIFCLGLGLEMQTTVRARQSGQIRPLTELAALEFSNQVGVYTAELETAWHNRDWPRVITILEALRQVDSASGPVIVDHLAHAYLQQGIVLRHKGFIEEALIHFEKSVALRPDLLRAQQEKELAAAYLAGIDHYQAGRWAEAIQQLETVWAGNRDYVNAQDLLYSAYYNQGLAFRAAGQLGAARQSLQAAIKLRPDLTAPRLEMARLDFALAPETPPPASIPLVSPQDQLIVVGVAEQRMLVYERGRQVFDFVVSTGEPGRDTGLGDFEILDKIDVAYASTWNLDMPYWMGIYWSGPLQNGIHALPIVKHTGYKLWDGYLGQRVSYGCVILSDEDAATLYEWAEVGARVKIIPTLADWTPPGG